MPIDNLDIHHTYDTKNNQVPIVQEKTQSQRGIEDTLSDINSKLDGLKLELPKTKEEQEKEVLELVKVRGLKESFDNGKLNNYNCEVTKIQDGIFSFKGDNGNVMYFIDNNGEILFGIVNVIDRPFIKNGKAFEVAGYIEKKENGLYNMYKVEGGKQIGPIDINSPEYYQAWHDIIFYSDVTAKLFAIKEKIVETKKGIDIYIDGGSFRFEDLELFLSEGLITKEIFDFGIKEMQKVIVGQCRDERLINMKFDKNDFRRKDGTLPEWIDKLSIGGIKESDLRRYYVKGYIDLDIAKECYKVLPEEMKDLTGKKKD